ncbi:DUF3899 domain-containing protein [Mycoplasmatota bacterium]|nr:DUF3899 domain-containing protein [Mycoplasmatota bacterium]
MSIGKIIFMIFSIVFTILILLFGARYDLIGWINATFSSGIILFGVGILIYVSGEGIFDIAIFGTKKFFKSIFSRNNNMGSYYEYHVERSEREKIPVGIILFTGLIYMGISFLLLYIFYH